MTTSGPSAEVKAMIDEVIGVANEMSKPMERLTAQPLKVMATARAAAGIITSNAKDKEHAAEMLKAFSHAVETQIKQMWAKRGVH